MFVRLRSMKGPLLRAAWALPERELSESFYVYYRALIISGLPTILLLGSDAVQYSRFAEEKRESGAKAWHNISVSTDAEDVKGLPYFKF
jgi:hypothetical protein